MTNREDFLTVAGRALEVAWHGPGPGEAPTLVFLHHGSGSVSTWRDFPAELARRTGCGALVYSRSGHGASDPCELPRSVRFMHDEGLLVLPELLEVAGVRDAVLVGHSDGGSIALVYAGGTPAAPLRAVIAEAAHVFCEALTVETIAGDLASYRAGELDEKLARHHGANADAAFRGWAETWLHPGFATWSIEEYLSRVRVPVLVIQGRDDEYGSLAQVDAIRRGVPGDVRVELLASCGHSPHRDRREATVAAMGAFVRHVLDPASSQ